MLLPYHELELNSLIVLSQEKSGSCIRNIHEQQLPLPHYCGIRDYPSFCSGSQAKNILTEQVRNCRIEGPEVHIGRLATCGTARTLGARSE
jgi:hypothetical protein